MSNGDFPFVSGRRRRLFELEVLAGTHSVVTESQLAAMIEAGAKVDLENLLATERMAAKLLGISAGGLKKRRKRGWSPPYIKVRRQVFYHLADILADILERAGGGHA